MTRKLWIVWNQAKNEGVVFTNSKDARDTVRGHEFMERAAGRRSVSSLGMDFCEAYQDDALTIEKVTDSPTTPEAK
jgi:hypothetical protein